MNPPFADGDPRTARLEGIERGVEERLREMAEAGELSGLPGEGLPFPKDDAATDERWAAAHVMKNAGVTPEWSELRGRIDAHADALVGRARRHLEWLRARESQLADLPAERILEATRLTGETDVRVRADLASSVAELNALVRRYDLIVPVDALRIPPFTLDRIFAAATAR